MGLLTAMQFMLNIRGQGYQEFAFRGESEYDYLHVDDNYLRLAQVIQIVPAELPYWNTGRSVHGRPSGSARVLPGKPVDPVFDLPAIVGIKGVSLSTSIIGEWYITFGWIAVLLGAWLHAAARHVTSCGKLRSTGPIRSSTAWPSWCWCRACARCRTWSS